MPRVPGAPPWPSKPSAVGQWAHTDRMYNVLEGASLRDRRVHSLGTQRLIAIPKARPPASSLRGGVTVCWSTSTARSCCIAIRRVFLGSELADIGQTCCPNLRVARAGRRAASVQEQKVNPPSVAVSGPHVQCIPLWRLQILMRVSATGIEQREEPG